MILNLRCYQNSIFNPNESRKYKHISFASLCKTPQTVEQLHMSCHFHLDSWPGTNCYVSDARIHHRQRLDHVQSDLLDYILKNRGCCCIQNNEMLLLESAVEDVRQFVIMLRMVPVTWFKQYLWKVTCFSHGHTCILATFLSLGEEICTACTDSLPCRCRWWSCFTRWLSAIRFHNLVPIVSCLMCAAAANEGLTSSKMGIRTKS